MSSKTALRDFLAKPGENKTMLDHRFSATYERAKKIVHDQVESCQKPGIAKQRRGIPPILPDELQGN